jgi:hypothetical protein
MVLSVVPTSIHCCLRLARGHGTLVVFGDIIIPLRGDLKVTTILRRVIFRSENSVWRVAESKMWR